MTACGPLLNFSACAGRSAFRVKAVLARQHAPKPTNRNVRCQVRAEEGSVPAPDRFSRKRILFRVGTNTDRRLGVSWSVSPVFEKVPARSSYGP
jgi:hypothetical protein